MIQGAMPLIALLILFAQGIPALRVEGGAVTGVLRTSSGKPVAGIRVAAAAVPDPGDRAPADALVSLAETDREGRYRLENIPPGRYYITAGRVDRPTYYPGTLDVAAGTVVQIAQGAQISNLDFVLKDESVGRAASLSIGIGSTGFNIPVQISVDGGGKAPVIVGDRYPILRLIPTTGAASEHLFNTASVALPMPSPALPSEYRVEIADLPEGYAVKSIVYGSGQSAVDLTKSPLRISAQGLTVSQTISFTVPTIGFVTGGVISSQSDRSLFVVLTRGTLASSRAKGVRVTGTGLRSDVPIYLSGVAGNLYADGSFEFEGVLPGRHTLARFVPTYASQQGISVVVGDRDVDGVVLRTTNLLPLDIEMDAPRPAGSHAPGEILPPVSIRGRVVQDTSGDPLAIGGTVTITGYRNARRTYAIDGEGRFQIPDLLPGSYRLELGVSGYRADVQTVVVDDGDAEVTFRGLVEPQQ